MAFIFERDNQWSDDDKEKMLELSRAVGEKIPPSSWVIDRERGMVFLCLSVGRRSVNEDERHSGRYALFVGQSLVRAEAHKLFAGPEHEHYLVTKMIIPAELENQCTQIKSYLCDAFIAEGKSYSLPNNVIKHVAVDFEELKGARS